MINNFSIKVDEHKINFGVFPIKIAIEVLLQKLYTS